MVDQNESDAELTQILDDAHTVAVVGIKAAENEDAHRIPKYLQAHGYRIVPINPKLDEVLGEPAHPGLTEAAEAEQIDLVNLFRASENIPAHTEEILAMSPLPRTVWMQLGIHDGPSASRLRQAGIRVVQDRCIMVDHKRLLQSGDASDASSA